MIRARVIGLACSATIFAAASVASMTGCSSAADSSSSGTTAETIRSTNVSITVQDSSGAQIGSGSGILIAPKLVLTAAHLVAGQTSWVVRTADGKVSHGVRGVTYDWLAYNDSKAHPAVNDLAVVYLDEAITLPAYPHVAGQPLASGASATRVHGTGTSFTNVSSKLGAVAAFPHSYITSMPASEQLDTGGAVLNQYNDIVGIVTGQGTTTGNLYIARTDALSTWVTDSSDTCDADGPPPTAPSPPPVATNTSSSSSGDIVVKTYVPPPSGDDDDDTTNTSSSSGYNTSSSSGYTSSSSSGYTSSSSSGYTASSSGTPTSSSSSSGSSSSSSGSPTTCTPSTPPGNCYGASCGTSSSSSSSSGSPTTSSSSSSSSGSSSSGSSSSSSGSSSSSSGGDDDDDSSPPSGGSNPITPGQTTTTSSGGASSSGSTSSSSSSTSSSSSSGSACVGIACDGGDGTIDYGACPACGEGDITVK